MLKFIFDAKNKNFMRLWCAQLISQFGDRVNQMALIGLIAERAPGSTVQLAKLLSFTIIPVFFVGPIAGAYVDRWDRRQTLFVSDFIRGTLVLTIPFIFMNYKSMIPIYIVVFLVFCFSRFHIPAKMSIIPNLVEKEKLLMANSLLTTTGMIAFVLGCSLGGFLVDRMGARWGFIWNSVTFFVSGAFVCSIPHHIKFRINKSVVWETGKKVLSDIRKSIFTELKEGFQYLIKHKEIRFIINMFFVLLSAAGAIYVVIIVFIQQSFSSVTKDLGILAVLLGVGLFLGAIGYGKWGRKFAWYKIIFVCLLTGGLMVILFALTIQHSPNLRVAGILSVILGMILGPIFIASNTVVHVVSDENMRGKVFSALEVVIHFAFLATMVVSSVLSEFIPRVWILVGVGGLFTIVGVIGLIKYKNGGDLALIH